MSPSRVTPYTTVTKQGSWLPLMYFVQHGSTWSPCNTGFSGHALCYTKGFARRSSAACCSGPTAARCHAHHPSVPCSPFFIWPPLLHLCFTVTSVRCLLLCACRAGTSCMAGCRSTGVWPLLLPWLMSSAMQVASAHPVSCSWWMGGCGRHPCLRSTHCAPGEHLLLVWAVQQSGSTTIRQARCMRICV